MTCRVFTLHGVAPEVDPRRFIYRNISDGRALEKILRARPKFVPLPSAMRGEGDALTIDDATRCGAEAASLAAALGHAVTLFVNPRHVDPPSRHWFHLVSALLDGLREAAVELDGERIHTRTFADRNALRARLKLRLRDTAGEKERAGFINRLSAEWNIPLAFPEFLEPLGIADLQALLAKGVDIQNHGWSHGCHARLDSSASAVEIARGRAWLLEHLGVDSPFFAVPFGDTMPKGSLPDACDTWLTVDGRYPAGLIAAGVWNREEFAETPRRWWQ